jgi:hypothetical protein
LGWLQFQADEPEVKRWSPLFEGHWIGYSSSTNLMHRHGWRYIGPASPDDARELRRLREGIEALAKDYDSLTRRVVGLSSYDAAKQLRALLKGPTP